MSAAIDEAKRHAEISGDLFSARLRHFVARFVPVDRLDAFDFQMELTRLMVDAMRHKSDCLSLGVATYADAVFSEASMRPLQFIMEGPKR